MSRRAAIVAPLRSPIGRFGGAFRDLPVEDLGAAVVRAVIARSGIDPGAIEDLVFAQSYANSETPCIGRWLALSAGLPETVPGMQLDRRCGGGLQSIATAAMMVESGACDVVLAGGVENMSRIEYYSTDMRWGARAGTVKFYDRLDRGRERSQPVERYGVISGMVETAENLAKDHAITREASDTLAAASHRKAAAAWVEGRFDDEVVPVEVPQRKGDPVVVARDEGIRPETSAESLAGLRAVMKDGTVTAGNASQQNDAASACLIVAEERLEALGLKPIAFFGGWAAVGCDPARMGIGPVPATAKVLQKSGLSLSDLDLIEVNEAFAAQVLAVLKSWDLDANDPRVNVNGSGISLGHPIGATGTRIMTTLLHQMKRQGAKRGLETMCVGGGQGMAAIFEAA
ncbi:acetyl-CoA C-acetyltransferase [Tropicimonas isoalkanivorans]|uniref:Acetyl-CoA C-acetyltransferase n=1 Tax=Tropicimonas isoalkanivorans TaxID=441112 RepID=A0A1I1I7B9_9RHOB|nr:acetyl-CoA C-acetyltransferase [Tropicimonas isoalkanivorans]SFC29100.1 acetyl-CoA C-acetyltransferase [Tropicimonas isoalkanivorans]